MIWTFTKWNYRASTSRIVRWWLRMTIFDKFIVTIGIIILSFLASFSVLFSRFGNWLAMNLPKAAFAFFILFIVDLIWDFLVTRNDLTFMTDRNNVLLATRCEYIGGHPELPLSRFVFLALGGSKANPVLSIIFSTFEGTKFDVNLIDVTDTKSTIDDKFGKPGFYVSLTSISPSIWKGYRSTLNIEYAKAGRKYKLEFSSFLRGNDEVQMWKNYITCMMAEADTGRKPYGQWKSLPEKEKKAAKK